MKQNKNLEQKTEQSYEAIKQNWLESERGWGIRPDGYSLHKNIADCELFIKEYWKRMPDEIPDEYSRPCSKPFLVKIDEKEWDLLQKSKYGIRRW